MHRGLVDEKEAERIDQLWKGEAPPALKKARILNELIRTARAERKNLSHKYRCEILNGNQFRTIMAKEMRLNEKQGHWGCFRNNVLCLAAQNIEDGDDKSALSNCLEVCFFDLNGCQNNGMYGSPPFDKQLGDLIPFSTDAISALIEKLGDEAPDCEAIFRQLYKKYRHLDPPVSEEKAWRMIQDKIQNPE